MNGTMVGYPEREPDPDLWVQQQEAYRRNYRGQMASMAWVLRTAGRLGRRR